MSRFALVLLILASMLAVAGKTSAVSFDILEVLALQGNCIDTFSFSLRVNALGTRQDSFYGDYFTFILTDATGQHGAHYDYTIQVGQSTSVFSNLGQTYYPFGFARPPVRPFTLEVRDTESHWLGGFPVLDSITFDPVDYGICGSLPNFNAENNGSVDDSVPHFSDGRINNFDMASPIVVYGHDFEDGRGLVVYSPTGDLLLTVIPEELGECTGETVLLASDNGVSLYRLDTCEYQMMAASLDGTKNYILIFNELYPNTGYSSHED
jgi:hypothetical protein